MLLPLWRKLRRNGTGPAPLPNPPAPLFAPLLVVLVRIDVPSGPDEARIITSRWYSDGAWMDVAAGIYPEARIAAPISFTRAIATVYWGSGRSRPSFGELVLSGGDDRGIDWLLTDEARGAEVAVFLAEQGRPIGEARQVAAARIDGIRSRGETAIACQLADTSSALERAVQSDLYTVEGLEGQPKPLTIGSCLSVPVWQGGLPDLLYDVHDDRSAEVSLVRDAGVELTRGATEDWERPDDPSPHHFELFNSPVGRVVADVSGAVSVIDDLIETDLGAAWTGSPSEPTGWDIDTTGAGIVTQSGGGAWLRNNTFSGGPDVAALVSEDTIDDADRWFVRVDVAPESFAGSLEVRIGSTVIGTVTDPGSWLFAFDVVTTGVAVTLRTVSSTPQPFPSAIVTAVRVYRRTEGSGAGSSTGEIEAMLRYLLVDRAEWPETRVDWGSVATLGALGWALGYHTPRPVATTSILDEIARSFGGWWTTDRLGRIRLGRLAIPSGAPDLTIGPDRIDGAIEITIDQAPGLSDTWSGARNWQPYSEGELAGSVQGTTLGSTLAQQFRARRRGAGSLWPGYRDAIARPTVSADSAREIDRDDDPGVPTLLQDGADVQAQADAAIALYAAPRHFLSLAILLDPVSAAELEPGTVAAIVSDRWGIDDTSRFTIAQVSGEIGSPRVAIRAWGAADIGGTEPAPPSFDTDITP